MLHALELENFKAFGKRARIPFAPITLIFGENSAGKSTILQALNLLKQTRESRETGVLLLPRSENGIVDLGSFQELLFDHELKRTLSISVEVTVDRIGPFRSSYKKSKIGIGFSFKRPSPKAEVLLEQIEIYDGESSERIAKFHPLDRTEIPQEFRRRMGFFRDSRAIPFSKLAAVKCVWLTETVEHWIPEFEWFKDNKERIRGLLEKRLVDLKHPSEGLREDSDRFREEYKSLNDGIKFLLSGFDLETYISRRHSEEMDTVLEVQGFFPIGIMSGKRSSWITEFRSFLHRRSDNTIFDVAQLVMLASRTLEQTLEALFPMGPFRSPPERWYIFRGTSPQDVGYRGDLLPDLLFRQKSMVKETNEWLKRLDIGYELKVESVGKNSGDLFEVRLIDIRRKERVNEERVNVALPDVGFGISQLLPFIVQSLVSGEQIISIEQPEVHVHPKLQADLGDLLAEAIKEPRRNRFIVETHSEHLILRLQRLVYEKRLDPKDVSVIYVSRGPEGAKAERLRLDDEGDFIDEWPNGFFLERLRELR